MWATDSVSEQVEARDYQVWLPRTRSRGQTGCRTAMSPPTPCPGQGKGPIPAGGVGRSNGPGLATGIWM